MEERDKAEGMTQKDVQRGEKDGWCSRFSSDAVIKNHDQEQLMDKVYLGLWFQICVEQGSEVDMIGQQLLLCV